MKKTASKPKGNSMGNSVGMIISGVFNLALSLLGLILKCLGIVLWKLYTLVRFLLCKLGGFDTKAKFIGLRMSAFAMLFAVVGHLAFTALLIEFPLTYLKHATGISWGVMNAKHDITVALSSTIPQPIRKAYGRYGVDDAVGLVSDASNPHKNIVWYEKLLSPWRWIG